jgi:hypothetical protein
MTVRVPDLVSPAVDEQRRFTRTWVQFFTSLGAVPKPVETITAGASPFAYTAPASGSVLLRGGTVTFTDLIRGPSPLPLGMTSGLIPVAAGDTLVVTYTVAPSMFFIPG